MTKQPSYRFTGLEDDWKEVKLGEVVASERKGKAKPLPFLIPFLYFLF